MIYGVTYNGHNGIHTGLAVHFVGLYVARGYQLSNDDAQVLVREIERLQRLLDARGTEERTAFREAVAGSIVDTVFDRPTWVQAKVAELAERAGLDPRDVTHGGEIRKLMEATGIATASECGRVAAEKAGPAVGAAVMLVGGRASW